MRWSCEETVKKNNNHSAAITIDGSLYTWGDNFSGQIGDGTNISKIRPVKVLENVKKVVLGYDYGAAITTDGSLYMWGRNYEGVLGDGTTTNRMRPVKVMENVKYVALGGYHSAAITADGSLYTWGDNHFGQLGDGTTSRKLTPTKIEIGGVSPKNAAPVGLKAGSAAGST